MTPNRWTHALENGAVSLPPGPALVFGARAADEYALLGDDVLGITPFYPDHAALAVRGMEIGQGPDGRDFATALVQIVKSKPRTLEMIAKAHAALAPGGCLLIDGQKTEGIASVLKALRGVTEVEGVMSKSHGKLLWLTKGDPLPALEDWLLQPGVVEGGYITVPGVFSAGGPDQGSEILIALVPELKGRVADFGSGWGYMAGEILKEQDSIATMDMIEADAVADACARENVTDPRATHIWGDVTTHQAAPYDAIICNPPFHTGREADPDLGRAFIVAAAKNLTPRGKFYMVANRHLPYEAALKTHFGTGRMLAELQGYKLYEAAKPKGARR